MPTIPIPTFTQVVFALIAVFTLVAGLGVVVARNLFHSALLLAATFFGVAGLYVMLEAEFLAVTQILIYVGAVATLITFAIMLTRGAMHGETNPLNRQWGKAALFAFLFLAGIWGYLANIPWPAPFQAIQADEGLIARLGDQFVTSYVISLEVVGILLMVALVGAILLARDDKP